MSRASMLAAAVLALTSAVAAAQTADKPQVPPPATQVPEATPPEVQRPPGTTGQSARPIHPAERDRIVVPPPADTERNINPK